MPMKPTLAVRFGPDEEPEQQEEVPEEAVIITEDSSGTFQVG